MAQTVYLNSAAPGTPGSGYTTMYFKTDKKPYFKDDTGTEFPMSGTSEPLNQIVYGTGAGVDSSTEMTFNPTTKTFILDPTAINGNPGGIELYGGNNAGPTAADGGTITLRTGNGFGTNGNGGELFLQGGDTNSSGADANGGPVTIEGGIGDGVNGYGGGISISAGNNPTGYGGSVVTNAGTGITNGVISFAVAGDTTSVRIDGNNGYMYIFSASGSLSGISGEEGGTNGGSLVVRGGDGTDTGGAINITGGSNTTNSGSGGSIVIQAGNANSGGASGDVQVVAGESTDSDGGTAILRAGNGAGAAVTSGGNATVEAGSGQFGASDGGIVFINAGQASGAGTAGYIEQSTYGSFIRHTAGNFDATPPDYDAITQQYVLRTQTTTAASTELFLDGTGGTRRMLLSSDSTWRFEIHLVARRTDADNESAAYEIKGCIDNNAGTTAFVGTPTVNVTADDSSGVWTVAVAADDTNDALTISVTGEAAKTIRWVAFVRTVEVIG